MRLLLLSLLLALTTSAPAHACWNAIDPAAFASSCPIIIRGPIVAVVEAAPGQERADDVAAIRIDAIHKNELKDVPLKVGEVFNVRMISRNNRQRTSTDLNYPLKTSAVWIIVLDNKGDFRIDRRPEQKQEALGDIMSREVRSVSKVGKDKENPEDIGVVRGTITKEAWIARQRAEEERAARHRAQQQAIAKDIREIATELAQAPRIDAAAMQRFQKAPVDVRRDIFQLRGRDQPLKGHRYVDVVEFILRHEPETRVRTFAASGLGYADEIQDANTRAGEILATAFLDKDPGVRLFACQAMQFRKSKEQWPAIVRLLKDEKKDVRAMAVCTLGRLGCTEAADPLLDTLRREGDDPDMQYDLVLALAQVGQTQPALRLARRCLQDQNWNLRSQAVRALAVLDFKASAPLAMEALLLEFERTVKDWRSDSRDRIYEELCQLLEKHSGQKCGRDPLAWLDWWETIRPGYGVPALTFDRPALRTQFADYQRLVVSK